MAPIKTVGVIGAGVSGVAAAAHLKSAGLKVTVFERSSVAGGVWVFDERRPPEPPFPSTTPSEADFTAKAKVSNIHTSNSEQELWHAPPGPCYEGLSNNVPTTLLKMTLNSWKSGTPEIVQHNVLKEYIQDTASKTGLDAITLYNTRVEHAAKQGSKWHVETTTLSKSDSGKLGKISRAWDFDYLVVATGHYHASRIPDILGLKEWKSSFPSRLQHSKSYRRASDFKDQNVLLVGSGVSAIDIAKEISSVAKQIYQVSRGGKFDLPGDMLPPNAVRVGEIESFNLLDGSANISEKDPIPGTVTLVDGTILKDIDRVILCTGYHMSLPFLQAYHRDELEPSAADTTVLITDGSQMHNLYHDIFYIPDPSLAFIGVPFYTATFTLFEFQAITVAKLFAGQASFPPQEQMRNEFNERVRERGFGKSYHSLMGEEAKYVDGLVAWINGSPGIAEQDLMKGHTEEWHISRASFVSGRSKEKAALLEIKDSALSAVS